MAQRPSPTDGAALRSTTAEQLLDAICARDFERAGSCLDDDAVLRAVLPPRFLEASGRDEILGWFRKWFEQAQTFRVLDRSHADVAGRARIAWRFELSPHPGTDDPADHLIEQTLYCDEHNGAITAIDLLCSGFRRAAS